MILKVGSKYKTRGGLVAEVIADGISCESGYPPCRSFIERLIRFFKSKSNSLCVVKATVPPCIEVIYTVYQDGSRHWIGKHELDLIQE